MFFRLCMLHFLVSLFPIQYHTTSIAHWCMWQVQHYTHEKRRRDMNAIKMSWATKYTIYNVYAYTCFVSIKQQQLNWSLQLHSIQLFSTVSMYCALIVCHLNFYGFLFSTSTLLHAFTLHWLHIHTTMK